MTEGRLDPNQETERILPLDGPYPPGRIKDAAAIAAELIRHLNHATQDNAVLTPPDIDRTIASLESLVMRLQRLLRQISHMLIAAAADPKLRTDGLQSKYLTLTKPGVIAQLAADLLRDDATGTLHATHATLALVRNFSARLYLEDPEVDQ